MTDAAAALGIDLPIVLGPFGGASSVELTALVSNLGGLGSFGLYGYSGDRIRETAAALRAATPGPFALNLWLPYEEPGAAEAGASFADAASALAPFYEEMDITLPEPPAQYLPPFEEQLQAALEARPAVLSFVFGVPSASVIEAAREQGIAVVACATTVDEAIALERGGVTAIVATGSEAGGHRVSFLLPAEESLVGSLALVPQVADAVSIPVIAAGGIADARGVAAAFALGASAVQVGTAFLRTRQSAISAAYREAITRTPANGTVLTRAMSGRLARGVPNRAIRAIEAAHAVAAFPSQNWLTGQFRAQAGVRGVSELQSLWVGQGAPLAVHEDAAELFAALALGIPN